MKEVVIMSYSHRTFTVLLLSLASCWLFALVEAQKSPPQCDLVGQIRPGNEEHHNGSCAIVNLTNIEVCESDGWRELCDTDLSDKDAQVICRELGYSDIGAAAGTFQQRIGGFPATRFPVCNGSEQNLSLCAMPSRNGADCTVNKLFVTCFLPGTDATMCGISTEPHSTTSDESTASSTTPEPLHPPTQVTDLSTSTSTSQSPGVTSTQGLGTSQQTQRNTLPSHITIVTIGASVGFVVVILVICVILIVVLYKRTRREKSNDQVSPDSPVKVQKSHETDGKDIESSVYSEVNNTGYVPQHQVPIYERVSKSQNLSEVSATESDNPTYAALDPDAIYSQIAPHLGPGRSSTLPAGLSGREPSLCYQKLDHSQSLPRSTAPPTSSSGTGCIVPHAVNRTALALASGNISETDLASPTQSDCVRYPSPRSSPKQCLSSSAKYPSPRGSPKQYPSSQSSTASKEEAPLIRGHSANAIVMDNHYHVLVPEAPSSAVIDHENEGKYDNDSQASTDAVCNQQMSKNCQRHGHINCELGVTLGGTMEDSNRHLYAILDPSPDAQHSPPSHHNTRQRSQSAVNNRSPPQQQKMCSHSRRVATDYSGQRAVVPNKYSQSQFHSSSAEFSNDPQMDTLV